MRVAVLYSSVDGQTRKIAEYISAKVQKPGVVSCLGINQADETALQGYDRIVIGASIRYGKYRANLIDFVNRNAQVLTDKNAAFFTVNLVARKQEKAAPDTNPYVRKFFALSTWKPGSIGVFAGKLHYANYRFFDKHMIRLIMFMTKGPTSLDAEVEFTNWQAVDAFTAGLGLEEQ